MYETIDEGDVPVVLRKKRLIVDGDAVGIELTIIDAQLAVIHVCHPEFVFMPWKVCHRVGRLIIATIHDTIIDNHLLDAVQVVLILETLP